MSSAGPRRSAVVVLLVLTAALGACGDDDDPDPAAAPENESTSTASSASSSPTARGERVDRAWELVSADDRNLTIRVETRDCDVEPNISTTELDESVQIEAYAYVVGEDCDPPPRTQWEKLPVALRDPLGDRELVGCRPTDGSVDCS